MVNLGKGSLSFYNILLAEGIGIGLFVFRNSINREGNILVIIFKKGGKMRRLSLFISVMLCFVVCSETYADFLFFKSKKKEVKKEAVADKPAAKGPKP